MQRQDDDQRELESEPQPKSDKRPYEAPKVEAVRLSEEAAESLT
jgi:hypothetical protein